MKITKAQLKQLIKEELEQSIDEAWDSAGNWKSRYSNRQDVEPETPEARKHRREKEERRRREREDLGYPPEKSKYFEENEELEAPLGEVGEPEPTDNVMLNIGIVNDYYEKTGKIPSWAQEYVDGLERQHAARSAE